MAFRMPEATANRMPTTTATGMGTPLRSRVPTIRVTTAIREATDRSISPVISIMVTPQASTPVTLACFRMFNKVLVVKNVSGEAMVNAITMMVSRNTIPNFFQRAKNLFIRLSPLFSSCHAGGQRQYLLLAEGFPLQNAHLASLV